MFGCPVLARAVVAVHVWMADVCHGKTKSEKRC
jgi:hypothetical protein